MVTLIVTVLTMAGSILMWYVYNIVYEYENEYSVCVCV